jgi:nucleotide-binding universal stress UspA family protein
MYRRILIPLDGSPLAEQVLPLAKMFAARFNATVVLFQAVAPIHQDLRVAGEIFQADEQTELARWRAREYLESIHQDFAAAGIIVEREVRVGAPAPSILEFAEQAEIDLIAMTTHGRTGVLHWVYGSVADKVLHGARVPILLVRANEQSAAPKPLTRILVPLDGSELAERALAPARQLAAEFDAEVLLLRVWETPLYGPEDSPVVMEALEQAASTNAKDYITHTACQLQAQGVPVRGETKNGAVVESILEQAQDSATNLIVMSTHGRSGVGRWVMGSVADGVLRVASVPVLLIRAGLAV